MADFASLSPAEQARQLGKPEGDIGIELGLLLNRTNIKIIDAVYTRLGLAAGMEVLEIGFGNGHLLPEFLRRADDLKYVGIEISQTMVEQARHFNAAVSATGQASFHLACAEEIPAAAASFDRVCAVNVIYFWTDPVRPLKEMRRVLKPNGFCVIAATSPESTSAMPHLRPEFGFHARDDETLVALHKEAGFTRIDVETVTGSVPKPDGTVWSVKSHLIIARP